MAKVCSALPGASHQQQSTPSSMATPAPPPPRRPRVREVSSRFMSPIVSSSSSGDLHLPSSKHASTVTSTSTHHHNQQQRSQSAHRRETHMTESVSYADENRLETARSLDTPFGSINKQAISTQKRQQQQQHSDGYQLRPLCSNKFPTRSGNFSRSRADTPVVQSRDRVIYGTRNSPRSTKIDVASVASTAAAKLVQLSGISSDGSLEIPGSKCSRSLVLDAQCRENFEKNPPLSDSTEPKTFSITDQESRCNSPVRVQNSKQRPIPDFRSSMPETDMLPTISSKLLAHSRDTPKSSAFPCYRSLNSPLPSSEQQFCGIPKSVSRPSSSGACLPPHPSTTKLGIEGRKGVKISNQQEQVHVLRLHYNHHLQWRFANAKAQAAMDAQSVAAEKSFHAIAAKISELHESVNEKHVELTKLKKDRTISTILEAQMPYLDEWSMLEGEYSSTLGGAVKALQDTSLRLPITGNVKADIEDLGKALNSASNVMEHTASIIERFLPKGEEMDTLTSELAEIVNTERALMEECGDLLSRTHDLQVMECSLRGQLLQLKSNKSLPAKAKE